MMISTCSLIFLFLTAAPSPPEGPLIISEVTADSVLVCWQPPVHDGGLALTGYVVERLDKSRTTWVTAGRIGSKVTAYCVQNLLEGCEYFFRVFAENPEGLSPPLLSLEPVKTKRPKGKIKTQIIWYLFISKTFNSKKFTVFDRNCYFQN